MSKLSDFVSRFRGSHSEDRPKSEEGRSLDWNPPVTLQAATNAEDGSSEEDSKAVTKDPAAGWEPPRETIEPRVLREKRPADFVSAKHGKPRPPESDWAEAYREAGITLPPHGYGVDKVGEMLESKHLSALAGPVKTAAVLAALEAAGVPIRDAIQDALLRDRALAAFQAKRELELEDLKTRSESRIQVLKAEIEAFLRKKNGEIDVLKEGMTEANQAFTQLQIRKKREEERLHKVVSHFVEATDIASSRNSSARPKPEPIVEPKVEAPLATAPSQKPEGMASVGSSPSALSKSGQA